FFFPFPFSFFSLSLLFFYLLPFPPSPSSSFLFHAHPDTEQKPPAVPLRCPTHLRRPHRPLAATCQRPLPLFPSMPAQHSAPGRARSEHAVPELPPCATHPTCRPCLRRPSPRRRLQEPPYRSTTMNRPPPPLIAVL